MCLICPRTRRDRFHCMICGRGVICLSHTLSFNCPETLRSYSVRINDGARHKQQRGMTLVPCCRSIDPHCNDHRGSVVCQSGLVRVRLSLIQDINCERIDGRSVWLRYSEMLAISPRMAAQGSVQICCGVYNMTGTDPERQDAATALRTLHASNERGDRAYALDLNKDHNLVVSLGLKIPS